MQAQGAVTNAKEDTVYFADVDLGDLWVDQSQFGVDLIEDSTAYELDSDRTALTGEGGRELYVRFFYDPTDSELVILSHNDETDNTIHTYQIKITSTGELSFTVDAVALTIVSMPALSCSISASWSTRDNPHTTGASDALISEFIVYNHTSGEYVSDFVQVSHAVPTTSASYAFGIGGYYEGGAMTSGKTPTIVRIGRCWHNSVEMAEDWIGTRAVAPQARPQNYPIIPLYPEAGFGDAQEWAGAANSAYAKRIAQATQSAVQQAPLLNEVYSDPWEYRLTGLTSEQIDWMRSRSPWSARDYEDVTKLRYLKIPRRKPAYAAISDTEPYIGLAGKEGWPDLRVRVHVKTWVTTGDPVMIRVSCRAMTRPPTWTDSLEVPDPVPPFGESEVISALLVGVDHTSSGIGEWLDLGKIKLPSLPATGPWSHGVYLCLSWGIAPMADDPNQNNARLEINAWQVVPAWPERWEA